MPQLVAKRIIEAAKNGKRDPIRLHWQAVMVKWRLNDMKQESAGLREYIATA
jgi:hypothetical protein